MAKRQYMPPFCDEFCNEVGDLNANIPTRAGGKKLLEWTFRVRGADTSIPVTVHIEHGPQGMLFSAHCSRLAQPASDTDINRLHALVESQLIEQAACISNIAWVDWLEVVVKGDNSDFSDSRHSALGANLHIQVSRLKRGIHPTSGDAVTINSNGVVVPFPQSKNLAEGPVSTGLFRLQSASGRSYIPATAANEAALRSILARMEMLRDSLADVLSQGNVSESLVNLDRARPFLPVGG
jgi:hypothetical protein